jgi:hypothetical protein
MCGGRRLDFYLIADFFAEQSLANWRFIADFAGRGVGLHSAYDMVLQRLAAVL